LLRLKAREYSSVFFIKSVSFKGRREAGQPRQGRLVRSSGRSCVVVERGRHHWHPPGEVDWSADYNQVLLREEKWPSVGAVPKRTRYNVCAPWAQPLLEPEPVHEGC